MKNTVSCDAYCELQNSVNHRIFECKWLSWGLLRSRSVWAFANWLSVVVRNGKSEELQCAIAMRRTPWIDAPADFDVPVQRNVVTTSRMAALLHLLKTAGSGRWPDIRKRPSAPLIRPGYPLNLSILTSRGKETSMATILLSVSTNTFCRDLTSDDFGVYV